MAECTPMELECMSALSAAPAPVSPTCEEDGEERASKRRRLGSAHDEENPSMQVLATTLDLVHAYEVAPAVEEHKEATLVEQSEQSPVVDDATVASTPRAKATLPFAELTSAPTATRESDESQESSSSPPLVLAPKRMYKCRMGCSAELASSSNRLRHERAKHPVQQASLSTPVDARTPSQPPQTSYLQRHRFTPRVVSPAVRAAASASSVPAIEDELDHEEEDVELEQFAAAAALSSRNSFTRHSPATTTRSEDEEKPDGPSTDETPASSSETSRSNLSGDEGVPGMRPLFTDAEMQEGCLEFLRWLALPPITQVESLVKSRKGRLASHAQLHPLKNNIRFVFLLLQERELAHKVDLEVFTRLDVCRGLFDALSDRGVGAVRFHALFLLVKKVIVFLSSRESTARRQFRPPSVYESYYFVEGVCSDSGMRRKQEGRNRVLLGVETTKQLMQGKYGLQMPQPFSIPAAWSSSASTSSQNSSHGQSPPRSLATEAATSVADDGTHLQPEQSSANEMSTSELQLIAKHCLANLRELMTNTAHLEPSALATRDRWFQANLITAVLTLGLSPRCQVLRQMRLGSSFRKHADGVYWIKLLGQQSKNGMPVLLALPQLTDIFDHFLDVIRPRLLAPTSADAHDAVFVNKNGSPRTDFSACTTLVTTHAGVGPKNAHSFRSALVTTVFESGACQDELSVLANLMAHDPSTAARSYHRPQYSRAAVLTNSKVANLLLQNA